MSIFTRLTDSGKIITQPTCEVKTTGGGLQLRYKLPTGGKISISESGEKPKIDKAHFHKGLVEIYTIHKGIIYIFTEVVLNTSCIVTLDVEGECVYVAERNKMHSVLQMPGAVFTTQTVGTPVPNPERGNNDWCLANSEFSRKACLELESIKD